jgi:hypothetical protein
LVKLYGHNSALLATLNRRDAAAIENLRMRRVFQVWGISITIFVEKAACSEVAVRIIVIRMSRFSDGVYSISIGALVPSQSTAVL